MAMTALWETFSAFIYFILLTGTVDPDGLKYTGTYFSLRYCTANNDGSNFIITRSVDNNLSAPA